VPIRGIERERIMKETIRELDVSRITLEARVRMSLRLAAEENHCTSLS
jgi:hypothetical protein